MIDRFGITVAEGPRSSPCAQAQVELHAFAAVAVAENRLPAFVLAWIR